MSAPLNWKRVNITLFVLCLNQVDKGWDALAADDDACAIERVERDRSQSRDISHSVCFGRSRIFHFLHSL